MSIKKIEPRYRTSDGQEFDSEADAERHEALTEARRAYEDARCAYGRQLAETQRTADGHPFSWSRWTYWFLHPGFSTFTNGPRLVEVSFLGRDFELDGNDELRLQAYSESNERRRDSGYAISSLYRDRAAAERALLAAQEAWLNEVSEEVAELRERVGGQGK